MRATRFVVGAALIASGAAFVPAGAVTTASPLPNYLDSGVNRFAVYANNHWTLGDTRTAADAFSSTPAPEAWGYGSPGGDPVEYMWADNCSAGAQTVDFRRQVWLPGRPHIFEFHARSSLLTSHGQTWSAPFRVVKLFVNGTLLTASATPSMRYSTSDAAKLAAFRAGPNTFRVVVVKRANPSYISACSGLRAPARLGIQVALAGSGFPVDLGLRPQTPADKLKYIHLKPGETQAFIEYFTLHNYGPSWSRAGHFQMSLGRGFMDLSYPVDYAYQEPFHPCTVTSGTLLDCVYDDDWLPPGGTVTLTAYWKLTAPTDESNDFATEAIENWSFLSTNGQTDIQPANNIGGRTVVFCFPAATDYGCDKN